MQRSDEMKTLTIGKVARRADVGIETIRFYERQKLIEPPPRSASGYRQYPTSAVQRLRFIRRAKELGFSLKEIRELLELQADPQTTCDDIRQRAEQKLADINTRISDLQRMGSALDRLIAGCSGNGTSAQCPVMQAILAE